MEGLTFAKKNRYDRSNNKFGQFLESDVVSDTDSDICQRRYLEQLTFGAKVEF